MRAYVVSKPGGPEVLELVELPDPVPEKGQVLIGIKAFGLNRAEAITRMGGSGSAVPFPKVIGIECVGIVLECPGGELIEGQTVAAAMGGMGRRYNGSYAEKTVVPVSNVFPLETSLDWVTLASIPETFLTAWGCCFKELNLTEGARVVIRPGASALGIAVTQLVNYLGGSVIGITRSSSKRERLLEAGMSEVLVSDREVADSIRNIWPEGVNGVIDTVVSEQSLSDEFNMVGPDGRICLAGSLAESYGTNVSADFTKALADPRVSFYASEDLNVEQDGRTLQMIIERVEKGEYKLFNDSIFPFSELVRAHEQMDRNGFTGKVVIQI